MNYHLETLRVFRVVHDCQIREIAEAFPLAQVCDQGWNLGRGNLKKFLSTVPRKNNIRVRESSGKTCG